MRKTYSILSIARRHPHLFCALFKLNYLNPARLYADAQNEVNRIF